MKQLLELYKIPSPSGREKRMIIYITGYLHRIGVRYRTDRLGNIYAVKGNADTYPCIVAHTDEVHERGSGKFEVLAIDNEILIGYDTTARRFSGIGADDKNGIWVCLKCLEQYDNIKCVFFAGEETGCVGSRGADMGFFDDCRFVLQCDRRGSNDFITQIAGIELCSAEFIRDAHIHSFGYIKSTGMITDVLILKERGLSISCANISCGYYNPHTDEEYTRLSDLVKCLTLVRGIISGCTSVYGHTAPPRVVYPGIYRCGMHDSTVREMGGDVKRCLMM